ncbi:MAG: hypothetical protein DMF85_08750 [Acidobacteria bacterium]|nr:MAG: hypothetical protein DMF85_08750 [Acidobacteriota bacterium]
MNATRAWIPGLLVLTAMTSLSRAPADRPAPCSCLIQPDKNAAIVRSPGRAVYCGLDLGSRSAKLSVVSMENDRMTTIRDERQCKRTLGFGALVFDSRTKTRRALPDESIGDLVDTIREYQRICALDGGTVVAAGATQWSRDATNIADVTARVKSDTGLNVEVLTPAQEAEFAYVAAAAGASGRIVLDPGSNSFELAWQERGSTQIRTVLVEYGYVRGAVNDVEPARDYESGRAAYQSTARTQIDEQLARLTPPASLAALGQLVSAGAIGPDVITLGLDGAVFLYPRGLLRAPGGGWISDGHAYDAVLAGQPRSTDPSYGLMAAAPLSRAELTAYFSSIGPADFKTLAGEPVRTLYGQKALVVPALVELLLRELGARQLVMVPQENASGHMLAKLLR